MVPENAPASSAAASQARLKASRYFAKHYLAAPNAAKTVERFAGPLLLRKQATTVVKKPGATTAGMAIGVAATTTAATTAQPGPSPSGCGERPVRSCGVSHGCVGAVQGWRAAMEDAHVVSPLVPGWPVKGATPLTACLTHTALSCFAVLDGHGGAAVSQWCAQRLVSCLQAAAGFERGSRGLEAALAEAIRALDQVRLSQAAALGS